MHLKAMPMEFTEKKRKLNAETIQSLKFQKQEYGKEKKRSARPQKDARAPRANNL